MYQSNSNSSGRSSSRSRSRENLTENNEGRLRRRPVKPKQQIEKSSAEKVADQISIAFIRFFEQIGHRQGFIMIPSYRAKLQQQQLKYSRIKTTTKDIPKIKWKSEPHWDLTQQKQKIESIFKRKELSLSEKQIECLKKIFIEVSPLFADETTSQLYELLMDVIGLCNRHKHDYRHKARTFFVGSLRNSSKYIFFGFKFSELTNFKLKQEYRLDEAYESLGYSIVQQLQLALSIQN